MYRKFLEYRYKNNSKLQWTMFGFEGFLLVMDAKLIEVILTSSKILNKSHSYTYLHNWLGTGLLTSTGNKWKKHRKIITPAFHFKILEDFIPSFDTASDVLVDVLKKEIGKPSTNIFPYITLCMLDSICESAMGTTVNAQKDADSLYVRSVKQMCRIIVERTLSPMGQFNSTYQFTKNYKLEREAVTVLHNYTYSVIKSKKEELSELNGDTENYDVDEIGMKRRRAFLDLLLEYSKDEQNRLSDENIREEVDTFMFEGHDTTAAAISFCVYLLSKNRDCQEKAFAEIKEIFGDDKNRKPTQKDLQDMKYLELVLKESLRLFPSVPFYARELTEDLKYGELIIPKGTTMLLLAYIMQLDPEYFPNPKQFNPERFVNNTEINTFSYVPFSAGPRNCIGQKFAMLSMKSTISKILKNYDLFPVDHEMEISSETVLTSKNGVKVQIRKRIW
nr:cytochrome P450 4c3-like [Onthophagus taurus]